MDSAVFTIFEMIAFLFLLVGGILGWIIKGVVVESTPRYGYTHPELFDDKGNLIPDEVVALKIEPGFYDEFHQEYDNIFDEDDED